MMHALIAGVSSGIGSALAEHLSSNGWVVSGTARHLLQGGLAASVSESVTCDFADSASVDAATERLASSTDAWDLLVVAPATMNPIGNFANIDFDAWAGSVHLNLVNQLRFVHRMLPYARRAPGGTPVCVLIAGGGTNSAPVAFSAYTVSKIALVKAVELLDAETPEVTFTILGPGWVRTSIHQETLTSAGAPDEIVQETQRRMREDDFIPMRRVLDAVDWIISQPKEVVGGRNFSVGRDPFDEPDFVEFLRREPDAFRLRRSGNDAYRASHER
jgi:NAD(P)-dependent dehydrogenase (short-subunit alcohol dehydrogenase family)